MKKIQMEALQRSNWFKDLSNEVLQQIIANSTAYILEPEKPLITIGDIGNSMFLILEGWVKIVIPDEFNDEIVVNHLGPGELVGEMSLLDQKPRSASVIALTNLSALEFTREKYYKLLEEYPAVGIHMISAMSHRMRFTLKYLENAITWSKKISEGDYSFIDQMENIEQKTIIDSSDSDDVRTNNFLYSFFQMAKIVQTREQDLQDQLHNLSIQINQVKRDRELHQITSTDFFESLKADIQKIKRSRENQ